MEILANFATPAANFATRFRHISHSRYLCPTKNNRQIFKTHLLLLVCDHSKKVEALSVADNTDLPQAVRKVTGSWGPITTYLCFGNLVHVYDGTCIPAVRGAPKLYRKVCDGRRKICDVRRKLCDKVWEHLARSASAFHCKHVPDCQNTGMLLLYSSYR